MLAVMTASSFSPFQHNVFHFCFVVLPLDEAPLGLRVLLLVLTLLLFETLALLVTNVALTSSVIGRCGICFAMSGFVRATLVQCLP